VGVLIHPEIQKWLETIASVGTHILRLFSHTGKLAMSTFRGRQFEFRHFAICHFVIQHFVIRHFVIQHFGL
jgi:hypothetical protein